MQASTFTKKNWPIRIFGIVLIFMALFSLFIGIAMPGPAWLMAMLVLLAQVVISRFIGLLRLIWIGLVIGVVHLLTFGPFPIFFQSIAKMEMPALWFSVAFVIIPFSISVLTIIKHRRSKV